MLLKCLETICVNIMLTKNFQLFAEINKCPNSEKVESKFHLPNKGGCSFIFGRVNSRLISLFARCSVELFGSFNKNLH
jgi:hypothetical protein